tara:strand:+ start:222 stop:998 length:777 start_codon:yes stop_codon:yes gene_type:complete
MKNLKKKSAIILCGGRGTRLGSLGKKIPKSLVKINSYPIIWYIINNLKKNSFNHFILPVGYKGNLIKKYIKKISKFKRLHIDIVETGKDTPIAKRIHMIKDKVISNNFLLMNGDAVFDFNLSKIFKEHENKGSDLTFIGSDNQLAYGTIGIINKRIVNFDRNITFNSVQNKSNKKIISYVYSGMSIFNKKLLSLKFKNLKNFEKQLYPLIIRKFKCDFKIFNGFWHSIDNLKDIDNIKMTNNKNKCLKLRKLIKKLNG